MGRKGKGKKGSGDTQAEDTSQKPTSQEQQVGTSQQSTSGVAQESQQSIGRGKGKGKGQPTSQPVVEQQTQPPLPSPPQQQQQQARGPPQQQQQPTRGPPQQQQQQQQPTPQPTSWGKGQQHVDPAPQQQTPRGPPQQQQPARGPPQQQPARGPPQQQQPARGPPQQQQQQQPAPQKTAWGKGQQHVDPALQQQQQQQQQQQAGGPPQQRQQPDRGPPQQQQQQQQTKGPPQQQQQQQQQQAGGKGRGKGPQQGGDQQRVGGAPEQQQLNRGKKGPSRAPSATPSATSTKSDSDRSQASTTSAATGAVEQLAASMQKMAIPKEKLLLEIPHRKNLRTGGKMGRPIQLETNHVALNFKFGKEKAVHYDVAITPDKPKRLMRPVWNAFKAKYLAQHPIAFDDFRNAYSPKALPFTNDIGGEVEVAEDQFSKPRTYKVVVKFAAYVNLTELLNYMATGGRLAVPQEALQCIDIVLRNCSAMRFTKVGRSFFSPPQGRIVTLGDGLELWHGFFQSAVIGWKPFLNVDVAHKGFPTPQSVLQLMAEMSSDRYQQYREGEINDRKITQIQSFLKGLKIQYEIPRQPASRRSYRINGLKGRPNETTFEVDTGAKMTITAYYANVKGYTIQYPNIPIIWVGPKDRNIYLPAELCTIMPGQVVNRKLNEIQTSAMVRSAATSTDIRKQKILDSLNLANFNNDPVVRAFGMNVGNQFEQINARVLNPPQLQYGKSNSVMPSKGVWRASSFLDPSSVPCWTIINLDGRTRDDNVSEFARNIRMDANRMGVNIGEPLRPFPKMDRFQRKELQTIFEKLKKSAVKLAFVIIPDFPSNVYSQVKQTSELVIGLVTQCIKSRTMFKMNPQTVGNILLKVNAKMNGLNHTIADISRPPCLKVPCMIMGADVTHPSPDQNDIPSVAAVTASCDPKAFKYNFCWRLQPARQEIIVDLENIVKEQLMFFYRTAGHAPHRIIFFRDGVSEGQFREVMNMEVQAIRRACQSMPGNYRPPITFLVVQKRHHTRFFPRKGETDDRNNNVRAGTVVDTEITHPSDLEYYLVSHASIQGVARPTKYRVLWDDSSMQEDELEHLTYYLCHLFSRCTRSVSYPAPTYYAHLAAFRARVYLEGEQINLDNLPREQATRAIKKEVSQGFPMFFV